MLICGVEVWADTFSFSAGNEIEKIKKFYPTILLETSARAYIGVNQGSLSDIGFLKSSIAGYHPTLSGTLEPFDTCSS